jgi:hypothetical protein
VLSVSKRTPRILLNTDEYPECVETTPTVFGPVTAGSTCCRGVYVRFSHCVTFLRQRKKLKNEVFENDRILLIATVKSGRSVEVCEIELIWAIENVGK